MSSPKASESAESWLSLVKFVCGFQEEGQLKAVKKLILDASMA